MFGGLREQRAGCIFISPDSFTCRDPDDEHAQLMSDVPSCRGGRQMLNNSVSQALHLERRDYASETVLTAVNRLCRAKLPVSQREEFCKRLSVSSSSLCVLTYSCCRDYSSYVHLWYLSNADVDLASDGQRTRVECTCRGLWFSCWSLSHHVAPF